MLLSHTSPPTNSASGGRNTRTSESEISAAAELELVVITAVMIMEAAVIVTAIAES